jgi:hypothetical protein
MTGRLPCCVPGAVIFLPTCDCTPAFFQPIALPILSSAFFDERLPCYGRCHAQTALHAGLIASGLIRFNPGTPATPDPTDSNPQTPSISISHAIFLLT